MFARIFTILLILVVAYMVESFGMGQKNRTEIKHEAVYTVPSTIEEIVNSSSCAKYCFKEYSGKCGRAPKAFLRGIAWTYAKSLCNPTRSDLAVAGQKVGNPSKDALAHYGIKTEDPLQSVYTLMVGSALRESSGIYCMGKDGGASNTEGETCESGLYQTSYNSRKASPVLPVLFSNYFAEKGGKCFLGVFSEGMNKLCTPSRLKNYGTGNGVVFQKLSKECPAFATEYAAVMFRVERSHYGPLNKKAAEYRPECFDMFGQIKKLIKENPAICQQV